MGKRKCILFTRILATHTRILYYTYVIYKYRDLVMYVNIIIRTPIDGTGFIIEGVLAER